MTIITQLREATWAVDRFERYDAAQLADRVIDRAIAALRRNERWRAIPRLEVELALADLRTEFEQELYGQLGDLARVDELLETAADVVATILIKKQNKRTVRGR